MTAGGLVPGPGQALLGPGAYVDVQEDTTSGPPLVGDDVMGIRPAEHGVATA